MKLKFLILGGFFALSFHANAQTEKGKHLIGGSIGFTTLNSEQGISHMEQNSISVGPKYGYFIGTNLAIGLDVNYEANKSTSTYQQTYASNGSYYEQTITQLNKSHNTNIGALVRYYVGLNEKFKFFGQFNAGIGFGRDERTSSLPPIAKTSNYGASLSPSIAFFPAKKLAIEFGFGLISYFNSKNDYEDNSLNQDYRAEIFRFGFDTFEPKIGINFHL